MKISRFSDHSISFIFDNLEIELCYPLIILSSTDITFKLNAEISYYKLDLVNSNKKWFGKDKVNYIFTFLLLGFGIVITYTIKNNEF